MARMISPSDRQLRTRQLTACGILSALSVVFLSLGSLVDVLDLTVLVVAGLCVAFVVIEIDTPHAWLVWAVTAVIALLILPSKAMAVLYLMGGMYPVAKAGFERFHPLVSWVLKLSMFNTVQLFFLLIAQKVLHLTGEGYSFAAWNLLLNNAAFLVYDFALTLGISAYLLRIRRRLKLPKLK